MAHSIKMRSCLHCQDKDVIVENAFNHLWVWSSPHGILLFAPAKFHFQWHTRQRCVLVCTVRIKMLLLTMPLKSLNITWLRLIRGALTHTTFLETSKIFGHIFGFDLLRMEFVYLLQRNAIFNVTLDKDAFLFALSGWRCYYWKCL